jgi:hypothetical protein
VLDDADPDGDEDADPDGDEEADPDGDEPDPVGEGDRFADADGELDWTGAPLWLAAGEEEVGGSLLGGSLLGGSLGELLLGDGEGDGDGEAEWDGDGEGDGDGEAEAGNAWHTVSVSDAAAALGLAAAGSAVPSTPRMRKLPLTTVTAASRTCAKRISGLSPLLVRVTVFSSMIRRCLRGGWVPVVISANRLRMRHASS